MQPVGAFTRYQPRVAWFDWRDIPTHLCLRLFPSSVVRPQAGGALTLVLQDAGGGRESECSVLERPDWRSAPGLDPGREGRGRGVVQRATREGGGSGQVVHSTNGRVVSVAKRRAGADVMQGHVARRGEALPARPRVSTLDSTPAIATSVQRLNGLQVKLRLCPPDSHAACAVFGGCRISGALLVQTRFAAQRA